LVEDAAEASVLNRLAEQHELGSLQSACEAVMARAIGQPQARDGNGGLLASTRGADEGEKGEKGGGGEDGQGCDDSFSESFEVVDAMESRDALSPPPRSFGGGAGLCSQGDDDEAESLRDASNAAARLLVREDLASYLVANPGPRGTFVGWIASLHPENVHLDARMWIEGNDWLEAWRAAKGTGAAKGQQSHAEDAKPATAGSGIDANTGDIVTSASSSSGNSGSEAAAKPLSGSSANGSARTSSTEPAGGEQPEGEEEGSGEDEDDTLLLRPSQVASAGGKKKGAPTTLESFFRGWGRGSASATDKGAAAETAADAADAEGTADATAAASNEPGKAGAVARVEDGASGSDASSSSEEEDDDEGGFLDPRVEQALSAYTAAVAEHNALAAAAHACSGREVDRRLVPRYNTLQDMRCLVGHRARSQALSVRSIFANVFHGPHT
jgi:hypothetical protein